MSCSGQILEEQIADLFLERVDLFASLNHFLADGNHFQFFDEPRAFLGRRQLDDAEALFGGQAEIELGALFRDAQFSGLAIQFQRLLAGDKRHRR